MADDELRAAWLPVGLDVDALASLLAVELVRCVETVQDEGLRKLAELAAGEA